MKSILLVTALGAGLVLPQNRTSPPMVHMASAPATIKPQPVIILPAIAIGGAVGIAGWVGIKALNAALRAWEHRITNQVPDAVQFTFDGEESGQ